MKSGKNPIQELKKIFHEPNRLAIMSALCAADGGLTFGELKEGCALTDGNLSRHLKVLKEDKAIRIKKEFVDDKPRITVFITAKGLNHFNAYLEALAFVIEQAREALPVQKKVATISPLGKRVVA